MAITVMLCEMGETLGIWNMSNFYVATEDQSAFEQVKEQNLSASCCCRKNLTQ